MHLNDIFFFLYSCYPVWNSGTQYISVSVRKFCAWFCSLTTSLIYDAKLFTYLRNSYICTVNTDVWSNAQEEHSPSQTFLHLILLYVPQDGIRIPSLSIINSLIGKRIRGSKIFTAQEPWHIFILDLITLPCWIDWCKVKPKIPMFQIKAPLYFLNWIKVRKHSQYFLCGWIKWTFDVAE